MKVHYLNSNGEKMVGVLENPTADVASPIVVMVHGFTSSKSSKSLPPLVESLHQQRIATFRIDLYAHGESEGEFENLTISKAKDGVLRAIDYLKDNGYSKIALLGSSFGGITSIMAAAERDDLVCLALKCPVTNFLEVTYCQDEERIKKWKKQGYIYYKPEKSKPKINYSLIEDASKNIGYDVAKKIKIPTFMVHGDADKMVPIEGSQKLVELLPNGELYVIKGGIHHIRKIPEHFKVTTQLLTDFFIKHLKEV